MMKINIFGDFVAGSIGGLALSPSLHETVSSSDYNIVNFEAPVKTSGKAALKSGPSLQQDAAAPAWLKEQGVDVFTLANNHIMDYGEEAARKTVETLGAAQCLGLGEGKEAYRPLLLEKDGTKVAVFSLAELQFGMVHDFWSDGSAYGCAWINHPMVNGMVREAKRTADFVVIVAHAGLEGYEIPLPEWRDRYRELIDEGADAVIGGHTHTVQGYEVYHGKPIVYSLGNFCFPKNLGGGESWFKGEGVTLSLDAGKGMGFEVFGTRLTDNCHLDILPEAEWKEVMAGLNAALEGARYMRRINEIALSAMNGYNCLFDMGGYLHIDRNIVKAVARWLLGRCRDVHALNNLQCESHRWTITRALRLKNKLK